MDPTSDRPILRRAWRAYLASDGASAEQPDTRHSGARCLNKLDYIVLANEYRTLAVYRVRHSGALKRLRCWPMELSREPAPARSPSQSVLEPAP